MRALLILVKREIIDHLAYFVGAAVASGLIIALMAAAILDFDPRETPMVVFTGLVPATLFVVAGLCAFGATQMYVDRNRNISAFLMALPVTRWQLFAARLAAGVAAVLVLLLPLAVAGTVLINLRGDEVPFGRGVVGDMFWGIFLACVACYSVGLYAGWNRRSLAPTLGALPVVVLMPALVIIKGPGVELIAILLVFIVCCLTATWCRFSSSSL